MMVSDPALAAGIAAGLLCILLLATLTRLRGPGRSAEMTSVESRIGNVDGRLVKLEHDVNNIRMALGALPSKDTVNAVSIQVAELKGKVDGIAASQGAVQRSVERVEDFLLKASAGAIAAGRGGETGS